MLASGEVWDPVPDSAQSPFSPDGSMANEIGQVPPVNVRDKIKMLKIACRKAAKLLECPAIGRRNDMEFWESLLQDIKAEVREHLPRRWSTYPGLKESLNWETCRQGHKAEARTAPRKGDLAELREFEHWIDQWMKVWKLRRIQVHGSEVLSALQEHFGEHEMEDLLGEWLGDVDSDNGFVFLSVFRPAISEAVRSSRDQIRGMLLDSGRSCSEDLDESLEQLHSPGASSSRELHGSNAHISRETSTQNEAWRRRSEASPILGSTPTAACMRLQNSNEHTVTPSPTTRERSPGSVASSTSSDLPSLSNYETWPSVVKSKRLSLSSPQPAANKSKAKDKGKGIEKGSKVNQARASSGQLSSRPRTAPSAVTSGKPAKAKSLPVRENKPQSAHSAGHANRRKLSRTPAEITEENTRAALKHEKPREPVRIPHCIVPDKEPSPARNGLKCSEIPGSGFYGKPRDRTLETPPQKRELRLFDTPSSAAGTPGHQMINNVGRCKPQLEKQGDKHIMLNAEAWYNQDTMLPGPSAEISGGKTETRQREHEPASPFPYQDEEDDPFASSPINPTIQNVPPKVATDSEAQPSSTPGSSTAKKPKKQRRKGSQVPEQTPAPSPSASADTNTSPSPSKRSKRKRSNAPEEQTPAAPKSPSVDPFDDSPSPSVTRSKKRRKHSNSNAAAPEPSTPNHPARPNQRSKPATGHVAGGRRAGETLSPQATGEWQKKGENRVDRRGVTSTARSGSGKNWQGSPTPRKHWPGSRDRPSTTRSPSGSKPWTPSHKGGSVPMYNHFTPSPAQTSSPASSGLFVRSGPRSGARHGSRHRGRDYTQDSHASEEPGCRQERESTVATAVFEDLPREGKEKTILSDICKSKRHLARIENRLGLYRKAHGETRWLSGTAAGS